MDDINKEIKRMKDSFYKGFMAGAFTVLLITANVIILNSIKNRCIHCKSAKAVESQSEK